jgi:hypothetical protein
VTNTLAYRSTDLITAGKKFNRAWARRAIKPRRQHAETSNGKELGFFLFFVEKWKETNLNVLLRGGGGGGALLGGKVR